MEKIEISDTILYLHITFVSMILYLWTLALRSWAQVPSAKTFSYFSVCLEKNTNFHRTSQFRTKFKTQGGGVELLSETDQISYPYDSMNILKRGDIEVGKASATSFNGSGSDQSRILVHMPPNQGYFSFSPLFTIVFTSACIFKFLKHVGWINDFMHEFSLLVYLIGLDR